MARTDVSPLAGFFFALCALALRIVAQVARDDWEQRHGVGQPMYV